MKLNILFVLRLKHKLLLITAAVVNILCLLYWFHEPERDDLKPWIDMSSFGADPISLPSEDLKQFDDFVKSLKGIPKSSDPVAQLYLEAYFAKGPVYRQYTLKEYVQRYEDIHGRPPPPRFNEWFEYALKKGCVDFDHFDAIYEDLRLFWSISPGDIRKRINGAKHIDYIATVSIRNGKVTSNQQGYRITDVRDMIKHISKYLPDMDLLVNIHDQPRVVLPYNKVQHYEQLAMQVTDQQFNITSNKFTQDFSHINEEGSKKIRETDHSGKPVFNHAYQACPPDSPLRHWKANKTSPVEDIRKYYSRNGLVVNYTAATDICTVGPLIHDKHGFLSIPPTMKKIRELVPIFSQCTTSIHRDIRLPGNKYYINEGLYGYNSEHDTDWKDKRDIAMWRGITTGGIERKDTYMKIHRNILVDTFNASDPNRKPASLFCQRPDANGVDEFSFCEVNTTGYLKSHSDVGFYDLRWCVPDCEFLGKMYTKLPMMSSSDQYQYKYLIDVDGHSFSARFKPFLLSKSLPFKATIFREWHDSRIVPWLHFIPMDNTFEDSQRLLTYFTGLHDTIEPHQGIAERIALNGRQHTSKVLRKEDVEIYLYLLLLEYARILDDNRDHIGFVYKE
ncbi:glycosyltransferase family 90 protein [Tortispora caseinolytica NRRL Y-17796]|uniref:Glycosyltransferase family 90 protein n=1 Tax=Tortispora caseinolytica NRRL Y-17796 TaxID=767744 RepID=A0A1E4TBB6_9ASCO|nr:glycosyltransferase family 90 protein [Tortispora caseinolytica NRRL Y-17796]